MDWWAAVWGVICWFGSGWAYSRWGGEVRRLRALVQEAGSLQEWNRGREKMGLPMVYSPAIEEEYRNGLERR